MEHNGHVNFSSNEHLPCAVKNETNFYTWKRIVGHMVMLLLCNYQLGVTIIGYVEQHCNTHFQCSREYCLMENHALQLWKCLMLIYIYEINEELQFYKYNKCYLLIYLIFCCRNIDLDI